MDKRLVRALGIAIAFAFAALGLPAAHAQAALEPTQILIGAPSTPDANGSITVQAVLADAKGRPIAHESIYFTTQVKFLNGRSDVVLAQAETNASGQAVAHFPANFSSDVALNAEFRGDAQYAPSSASVQAAAAGRQVYSEHVGVDLPGFNVPPGGVRAAIAGAPQGGLMGFVRGLWPAMNGWPVAAVLLLVWSMYLFAVKFVFQIAASGEGPGDSSDFHPGRLP